jgi:hypothetical protein
MTRLTGEKFGTVTLKDGQELVVLDIPESALSLILTEESEVSH